MKRSYTLTLCLLFSLAGMAQTRVSYNKTEIFIRTETFIKVWGFLKYHHPAVAGGTVDWDSVFLAHVSSLALTGNNPDYNARLQTIIPPVAFEPTRAAGPSSDTLFGANYPGSIAWIDHSPLLNGTNRERLKQLLNGHHLAANRYVKIVNSTADYSGEKTYESLGMPDQAHRLLFLARCWNIVNYFAPYKYLIGGGWDRVLSTFIPRFMEARDTVSYYKALLELGKAFQDGHCQLSKSFQATPIYDVVFGRYTIPFYIDVVNDTVVVRKTWNDPSGQAARLLPGDVILEADHVPVGRILAERKKFISSSNKAGETYLAGRILLDGATPELTCRVKRGQKIFVTTVKRIPEAQRNWGELVNYTYNQPGYTKLDDSTLLIYAMMIQDSNLDTLKKMIHASKAVIFDVRNYPSNDAFYSIVDPFLSAPSVINWITEPVAGNPGKFKWVQSPRIGRQQSAPFKGKVVILADERTQSQGEYSCMVLQTIPDAVTIGRQTAGADGVVTFIPMGGGLSLSYSGYGVYYPDKGQTQQSGIRVDIQVPKTVEAIRDGTDETLQRALRYLKEGR